MPRTIGGFDFEIGEPAVTYVAFWQDFPSHKFMLLFGILQTSTTHDSMWVHVRGRYAVGVIFACSTGKFSNGSRRW
jgi:hypothetical protein